MSMLYFTPVFLISNRDIIALPCSTRIVEIDYRYLAGVLPYTLKGGARPNSEVDSYNVPGLKIQMARKSIEIELNFDERLTEF
jgi:hypothetical protein